MWCTAADVEWLTLDRFSVDTKVTSNIFLELVNKIGDKTEMWEHFRNISYLYARSMRILCLVCNLSRRNVSWSMFWLSSWWGKYQKLRENDSVGRKGNSFTKLNLQNIACPARFCISSGSRYILKSFVISIISPKSINKTLNDFGWFCEEIKVLFFENESASATVIMLPSEPFLEQHVQ